MGIVTLNDSVGPLMRLGGGARGPAVFSDRACPTVLSRDPARWVRSPASEAQQRSIAVRIHGHSSRHLAGPMEPRRIRRTDLDPST